MDIGDVVKMFGIFDEAGLAFWVDGGWGVDALLERQTRAHSDLDLAVELDDLPAFERILKVQGYARLDRPGGADWNWVLQNSSGLSVDLHGFVLDSDGNGILGNPSEKSMFPVGSLEGTGSLGGVRVRCVAAPFVLEFRNSFEPRTVDQQDVAALCTRFGLDRPSRFQPNG